jgi:hypothetical protein
MAERLPPDRSETPLVGRDPRIPRDLPILIRR